MKTTSHIHVRRAALSGALSLAVLIAGLPLRALAAPGDITTVAGSMQGAYPGNGGQATSASLIGPDGVVATPGKYFVSEQGSIYDVSTNGVRVVQNGIISQFAGGTIAPMNDGAPATQASISRPPYVAVDKAGDLFISDFDRANVRRVDGASGIITTVAGGGSPADGLGDNGPATSAKLNLPEGIAFDAAGNLVIDDWSHSRVRRVDATTGIITTVAGGGSPADGLGDNGPATSAQLASPADVTVDSAGDIFIADPGNCRVRKVDTSGMISTVAGSSQCGSTGDGGSATSATLGFPSGVRVNAAGELFIADGVIRKVDAHGIVSTIAGNGTQGLSGDGGPATQAEMDAVGLALDSAGNVFFADQTASRVRKVDTSGIVTTVAGGGVGDGFPATSAQLNGPRGLATDSSGNLYVADCGDNRVRKVDASGVMTSVAGGLGEHGLGDGGPATSAALQCPAAVAFGSGGTMYIADATDNRFRGRFLRRHHHRSRHRNGRILRRWRGRHRGAAQHAVRRGRGRRRQPLHLGPEQQPGPQGGHTRHDHDVRRQRQQWWRS